MVTTNIKLLSHKLKKFSRFAELSFNYFALIYISLSILFSRTFTGIYIGPFRLGEYAIGLAVVFYFYYLIKNKNTSEYFILQISTLFIFIVLIFYNSDPLLNPYIFKTSSYIWCLTYLFLGSNSKELILKKSHFKFIFGVLLYIYLISIFGLPRVVGELFLSISDKLELHKGSEIVLIFVLTLFIYNRSSEQNTNSLNIFIYTTSLFMPLILYKSRAAFIASMIFVIFELFKFRKKFKFSFKNILFTLTISFTLLTASTLISQRYVLSDSNLTDQISQAYVDLAKFRLGTYDSELPLLFVDSGRLYSSDGNLNWRIQMWQDMFSYIDSSPSRYIYGVGFGERLPVFDVSVFPDAKYRIGLDGLNEHLHNYWLTVFARGGLLHLLIFLYLYYYLFKKISFKRSFYESITLMIPILFVSFFDSSMENAHFPIIFYFYLGNQFINKYNNNF